MEKKIELFRESFRDELETFGDAWRVLRPITLIDLIKFSFLCFRKDNDKKHLVDVFNNAMKIKLLSRISQIRSDGKPQEQSAKFNTNNEFILEEYDAVFNSLYPRINDFSTSTIYDLNEKVSYLKVINDLRLDSYTEDVFDEIICVVYNLIAFE